MTSARVPASRLSRLWHYGNLFAGVAVGTATEAVRRSIGVGSNAPNALMSPQNVERIVKRLSRMRGAALKLGQMFSIQDNVMLPPEIEAILLRVQNAANFMPESQLQQVLRAELGEDWPTLFSSFDTIPFAAASMGQVHSAVLPSGQRVAVKVQYPGVAESIDSDLDSLKSLLLLGNLLPRGLYLDKSIAVARRELSWEVDYTREADNMEAFAELLGQRDPHFAVPRVFRNLSTKKVLVSEFVPGVPVHKMAEADQRTRDLIGERMLELCLHELFSYRFMQTDPNWTNFLYDEVSEKIYLVDFGSARTFSTVFTDAYLEVLHAAATGDRKGVVEWSTKLGFLTGMETEVMVNAHTDTVLHLGRPFSHLSPRMYDFGDQDVTAEVKGLIPTMMRYRLTPPPEETYSLHRKLSGAFLLCAKLRSRVACRDMFEDVYRRYKSAN
ncbi:ABC1-domain-containing protein [Gonapodya prolifera JEL478]|uniref:ABC1-domain-containing protein n=1 Tax=Gonapodya prolifera (strain JEL478) TaxID=1344416 RepID=A0A138ZYM2_GONPJ|nr:ABC1-domain-containing protein [Gonapodya prolifera JEL478]|eukprot:KXS09606.1 ABC1-domain-containing protein [Gonapodya prolifera JEL478]